MHITFITSFIPRKCGIATYTKDLALEIEKQKNHIAVIAMENLATPISYSEPVTAIIRQDLLEDYKKAAKKLNSSSTDTIHIQHEFGLFGGKDGEYILVLAKKLNKPLIVTFHTVLLTPTDHQRYIIQELARLSRKIIVMEEIAKDRLNSVYGLTHEDIMVISHGAPTLSIKQNEAKKKLAYSDKFIVLANNLLSRNKGIEYAIEAIKQSVLQIPNLLFLIVGETHPLVKNTEGESYREELMTLVTKLQLEKNVLFVNRYLALEELKIFLAATDIYITPYLDPQQITSGTLSYAVGAQKVCIATEYVHAKELLANGRGVLVPFRNSAAIATALIHLYKHPEICRAIEKKITTLKKHMQWSTIAEKHISLYQQTLNQTDIITTSVQEFISLPVDISYLVHLTDSVGILQHANHTIPDRKFGYSTDDNARALIVVSQLEKTPTGEHTLNLMKTYISFLQFAQEKDGTFHTFLTSHQTWNDTSNNSDAYGKAMWALGFYLSKTINTSFEYPVKLLFESSMEQIPHIRDLRTAGYVILGLYYYILSYENKTDKAFLATSFIIKLADFLVDAYDLHKDTTWKWFEDMVTYDNFRLPQALFAAYMITGNKRYKDVAKVTLAFITLCNTNKDEGYFDFIGQNGWYKKGEKKADYDQQPLEAAAAVEAYLFAAKALKKNSYIDKAYEAFEWFFGKNRNHRLIYDPKTKGVHDGLNLRGVNQNEGSESIVCFLMAVLSLQEVKKNE